MAYVSQELKKELAPRIKEVAKKYGFKISLRVKHHTGLECVIREGKIENPLEHYEVNTHWIEKNYEGELRNFLLELHDAMNVGNHNNSDLMTDYYDIGWFTWITFGTWNKEYIVK